ncbi:hypothetical protein PPERSA_02738 [Pseudocohnilembus persalinus]|uniref:RAP domain-containing protein n=1 Tax=Pseudocohnilembus persalinus TaxID=266149 RepID=A0A0V0R736_PSEPJ|nr:hypothetical protein PPERSA_02738 [Pseudocohnilembus persalinus]|eukprot:KRX10321.1 hypothetical protein PPERSA_02738 [Pseudocohnilembus persalinus]
MQNLANKIKISNKLITCQNHFKILNNQYEKIDTCSQNLQFFSNSQQINLQNKIVQQFVTFGKIEKKVLAKKIPAQNKPDQDKQINKEKDSQQNQKSMKGKNYQNKNSKKQQNKNIFVTQNTAEKQQQQDDEIQNSQGQRKQILDILNIQDQVQYMNKQGIIKSYINQNISHLQNFEQNQHNQIKNNEQNQNEDNIDNYRKLLLLIWLKNKQFKSEIENSNNIKTFLGDASQQVQNTLNNELQKIVDSQEIWLVGPNQLSQDYDLSQIERNLDLIIVYYSQSIMEELYGVLSIIYSVVMKLQQPQFTNLKQFFFMKDLIDFNANRDNQEQSLNEDKNSEDDENYEHLIYQNKKQQIQSKQDQNQNKLYEKIQNSNWMMIQQYLHSISSASYICTYNGQFFYKIALFINLLGELYKENQNQIISANGELFMHSLNSIIESEMFVLNEKQITLISYIISKSDLYQLSQNMFHQVQQNLIPQYNKRINKFDEMQLKSLYYSLGKTGYISKQLHEFIENQLSHSQLSLRISRLEGVFKKSQYLNNLLVCSLNLRILTIENVEGIKTVYFQVLDDLLKIDFDIQNQKLADIQLRQIEDLFFSTLNQFYRSYVFDQDLWNKLIIRLQKFVEVKLQYQNLYPEQKLRQIQSFNKNVVQFLEENNKYVVVSEEKQYYIQMIQQTLDLFLNEEIEKSGCKQVFQELNQIFNNNFGYIIKSQNLDAQNNMKDQKQDKMFNYKLNSQFEGLAESFLKIMGMNYEYQVNIKPFTVDFYIPDIDTVIEIQGPQHNLKYVDQEISGSLIEMQYSQPNVVQQNFENNQDNQKLQQKQGVIINQNQNIIWNMNSQFRIDCLKKMGKNIISISKIDSRQSQERIFADLLEQINKKIQIKK